jgi:hypothetical protein
VGFTASSAKGPVGGPVRSPSDRARLGVELGVRSCLLERRGLGAMYPDRWPPTPMKPQLPGRGTGCL